jgi:hypothetical protein
MPICPRTPLVLLLGLAAFMLNPAFACAPNSNDEFQYGASELRAAVEGTWQVTLNPNGQPTSMVTIRIEQGTGQPSALHGGTGVRLVRAAAACGTRTLVRPAGACVSITVMPLGGSVQGGDETLRAAMVSGQFEVPGIAFSEGWIELEIGPHRLRGTLSPTGVASDVTLWDATGAANGSVALTRIEP